MGYSAVLKLRATEAMKPPPGNENDVLDKLIDSARSHDDSKSIFGLLLLIERELRAEALDSRSTGAMPKDKRAPGQRRHTIFRSYIE
jgi:hypothetical protein